MDEEMDLEAVGISRDELNPKLFKLIVVSEKKEVLAKMGAKLTIPVGRNVGDRWKIFRKELEDSNQELDQVDTDMNDIAFFVGSDTAVMNNVMKPLLHSHQIIGIQGRVEKIFNSLLNELSRLAKKGKANLFDEVVDLCQAMTNDANEIQEQLGSRLGITYSEHNRAQSS